MFNPAYIIGNTTIESSSITDHTHWPQHGGRFLKSTKSTTK